MKTCGKCGEVKELSEFPHKKASPDGFSSQCKKCAKLRYENFILNNPGYEAERSKRRRAKDRENDNKYHRERYLKKRSYHASWHAKHRDQLTPLYISTTLGVSISQLTPELIELKREQLLMHRATKQLIKEIENGTK